MVTFLSPLFLLGLLAAAVPVLVHLSASRRPRKLRFSTTRFFTEQFLRSNRMSKMRELLLLACRVAVIAFFALALAQPVWVSAGFPVLAGQRRAAAVVIDDSASMSYADGGRTMFDRAQAAARELLDGLKPGDEACLLTASRRADGPAVLVPPTAEIGAVRAELARLSPVPLGTDLVAALDKADELLRTAPAASQEIYLFSDLQASGWRPESTPRGAPSGAVTFLVQCRPQAPANAAVTAVQLATARPAAGAPVTVRTHVRADGDRRPAMMRLVVDGKAVAERRLEKLASGRWAAPRFVHTFAQPGWHAGYVELDDDALPLDNRRHFAVRVSGGARILAVNGAPSSVPHLDELFFVRAALAASASDGEGKAVALEAIASKDLAGRELSGVPLVLLANVAEPPAVDKLEQYVDAGGSLLVFLGDRVDAAAWNAQTAAPARLHGGLLPGTLGPVAGKTDGPLDFAAVGETVAEHPALAGFAEARYANPARIRFRAHGAVTPAAGAAVLMRTPAGAPLLIERPFGKGRVMLFAGTANADWSNFPAQPAFLPWLYDVTAYLAQPSAGRENYIASGDAVTLAVGTADGGRVVVRRPDAKLAPARLADDGASAVYSDTAQLGVYVVLPADGKDADAARFVVNLEAAESDLTYLDDERGDGTANSAAAVEAALKADLPRFPLLRFIPTTDGWADQAVTRRRGRGWHDELLWLALLIAVVEPWLANRLSLRFLAPTPK